jgi:glycerol-3-phosphate dehydrogenase (NAD(P)+)
MGARQETFFGIAGVGDLATTCFSPTGRNRTCGEQLGKGRKIDDVLAGLNSVVEGVTTTRAVVALAEKYRVEMPITQAVHEVLFNDLDPIEAIGQLMTRQAKAEQIG